MVKGIKYLMAILLVVMVFVAYIVFAQSYKTLTPSVQITTCSNTLRVFLVAGISGYYIYTYKTDLTQLCFGSAPPGGKLFYTLILANFENLTIYNITCISSLNQTTEHIIDKIEVYGHGKLTYNSTGAYGFYFPNYNYNNRGQWPVTLGPEECVLIKYYIEIAPTCPIDTTYSWTVSFLSI